MLLTEDVTKLCTKWPLHLNYVIVLLVEPVDWVFSAVIS